MSDLSLLQALKFKGRLSVSAAESFTGLTEAAVTDQLGTLVNAGLARPAGQSFRLTEEGARKRERLLTQERVEFDTDTLRSHYDRFDSFNNDFKALMTDWQILPEGQPNDHGDQDYDNEIVSRLSGIHDQFQPLVQAIVDVIPRLAPYPRRFTAALTRISEGDRAFVARPVIDSYHTVWFEFHEELIGALGLTRADEAAAGRAL